MRKDIIKGMFAAQKSMGVRYEYIDMENYIIYFSIPKESYMYNYEHINTPENFAKRLKETMIQIQPFLHNFSFRYKVRDEVFTKETHLVDLESSTIEANARFFASIEDVPKKAITMGMGGIMNSKKILLIANGKNKQEIVNKAFFGPITPTVPASILQLHNDVTVIYSKN